MKNEQPKWKSINMGDKLPCQSFLRKKDGEILKLSTIGGVTVGQDCYYLPVDEVINVIKDYPIEESGDEKVRKALLEMVHDTTGDSLWVDYNIHKEDALAWLEKQDKQKPDDKIEPKFKVDDWINGYYTNYKVISVNNKGYVVEDVDGDKINILFENEKFHRLWTIQDAKTGDVLHSTGFHNDCIFIFNRLDNWKFDEPNGNRAVATGYCCLSISADKMEFGIQGPDCVEVNTIKPATKIQRDLLFQKMKEAGYEWDADKKELKKIEQKPILDVEIPFGAKDSELKEVTYDIPKGYYAEIDGNKVVIKKGEQKPAWSEENERIKNNCISFLGFNKEYSRQAECIDECINWLKSLKSKVTWKPSEEMLEALYRAIPENVMEISEDKMLLDKLYQGLKYGKVLSKK